SLNLLQRNKTYLYQVVHCFAYFIYIVKNLPDIEFSENMISRLETRWSTWEQPLFFLSFLLNPIYHGDKFNPQIKNLTYTHFEKWLNYYYYSWFKKEPITLLQELENYRCKQYSFTCFIFQQYESVLDFWGGVSEMAPELAFIKSSWDLQDETRSNKSESDYSISSSKDENTKKIVSNSEDIESEQEWKKIVENWFDMLLEENNEY
ncbi:6105_t:CDS:2, partial [Dentiscutata erythropus]